MNDVLKIRRWVIQAVVVLIALIFLARLAYLQVVDKTYVSEAKSNAIKTITVYPTRGLIYDRNGELIVYNEALYDIMVVPINTEKMDTAKFCELLNIEHQYFADKMKELYSKARWKDNVFLKQVSTETYTTFQEYLYQFPGFYGQVRTIRKYPHAVAAHILGDVGEVSPAQIEASGGYYKPGDYTGKSGIELTYEEFLRGQRGSKEVFMDALSRIQGSVNGGANDVEPVAGADLISTLDIKLQMYGEQLMQNKRGSIVAIEPSTGEILAMISSPGYDPNLLCGRERGANFQALTVDSLKPLFNRPIMAQYPPGSTFKALVGLIAMQEGAQSKDFYYSCGGGYSIPGYFLKCSHGHPSAGNIQEAIMHSCNPYFWQTFRNTIDMPKFADIHDAYDTWHDDAASFGLGHKVGVDLPGEQPGNIPTSGYYDNLYGKRGWRSATILSLGIGQGEILLTPLQLANLFAAIANKGYYYTPHLVREIRIDGRSDESPYVEKHQTAVAKQHFDAVIEGLEMVVTSGTGRRSRIPHITMCGKTGTAQNPHGEDHSIFAAFAPKVNPKIAIAVVVENGGGGSRYAAPISSMMIEYYLTDSISAERKWLEDYVLEANLLATE